MARHLLRGPFSGSRRSASCSGQPAARPRRERRPALLPLRVPPTPTRRRRRTCFVTEPGLVLPLPLPCGRVAPADARRFTRGGDRTSDWMVAAVDDRPDVPIDATRPSRFARRLAWFRRNRSVADPVTGQQPGQPRRARPSASVPSKPTVQHVGQPRQATAVTGSSASEIGPTTAIRTIPRTAATRPIAPLKRCSRTEPLASSERLVVAGSSVGSHDVDISSVRGEVMAGSSARRARAAAPRRGR